MTNKTAGILVVEDISPERIDIESYFHNFGT